MTQTEFMSALREALKPLPKSEIEKQLNYYCEMIDDMQEDGYTEDEAVSRLGKVDEIADNILQNQPLPITDRQGDAPRKSRSGLAIALAAIGSPLWVPLLIAAAALVLAFIIVLFSIVFAIFAVDIALTAGVIPLMITSLTSIGSGTTDFLWRFGASAILMGAGIMLFPAAVNIARLLFRGVAALVRWIKSLVTGKERQYDEKAY